MKSYVKTFNEVAGTHYWRNAPDEVAFLKYPHRHIFQIITVFEVDDLDREIEIFMKQGEIEAYLSAKYKQEDGLLHFEGMSCEMIAREIVEEFSAISCEVNEDGKGGAIIAR